MSYPIHPRHQFAAELLKHIWYALRWIVRKTTAIYHNVKKP